MIELLILDLLEDGVGHVAKVGVENLTLAVELADPADGRRTRGVLMTQGDRRLVPDLAESRDHFIEVVGRVRVTIPSATAENRHALDAVACCIGANTHAAIVSIKI